MNKSIRTKVLDYLFLAMIILPFVCAIALKVMVKPASDGISITGAMVYFTIPMPVMDLPITESQVNSVAVLVALLGLCLYLTHGMTVVPNSKRQLAAEFIVEKATNLVKDNMGSRFIGFTPFVAGIMAISAFSSLSSLLGLFPPTSDLNIVLGWAILVFVLITYYKLKGGLGSYIKGFFEPVFIFAPFNVIGEFATPISMSFRHYGNVLSGVVIASLVGYALQNLTRMILGWLPGILGEFPFLQVGLPAILSLYFDIFSGLMQAFIFAMLTMLYIATAGPDPDEA